MTLAPGVQEFLDLQLSVPATPWATLTADQARSYLATARQPRPPSASQKPGLRTVDTVTSSGLPVRIYDAGRRGSLLVYLHGGGWVMGDLDLNDPLCRTLAVEGGFVVVSAAYRLAPEHPYPTPLDDAYDATCWAVEHAAELGSVSSPDLIVAGTSAGGNLAAGIAIRARESDGPAISCQALLYPCLDDALDTQSYSDCATGYFLQRDQMRWYWEQYLPEGKDRSSPQAVPARCADLSGLPPALVATAEFDPLRDEGAKYACRLESAGVPVEYRCYTGQIHGFLGLPDLIPEARTAAVEIGAAIHSLLADS
jgi:acetyl esterase